MALVSDILLSVKNIIKAGRNKFLRYRDPVRWAQSIGVKVGKDCRLIDVRFGTEPYLVTLGDHVSATRTVFETHDGGVWVLRDKHPDMDVIKPVTVGSNVYFGDGCIVMPGVTVGDNVIVGAGSIVTRDIPSNSLAVGVPARVIKSIDEYEAKTVEDSIPTKRMSPSKKREWIMRFYRNN